MNKITPFALSFIFLSKLVSAQMIPTTTTMQTPYGKVHQTHYIPAPGYYGFGSNVASIRRKYQIVLPTDSVVTAEIRINIKKKPHTIKVKDSGGEKHHLTPSQTKGIACLLQNGSISYGIPADSCWLFKVGVGKINAYSFVPEPDLDYTIAIQQGDGAPIVSLTKATLLLMVADNPKAKKQAEKGKLIGAIENYNKVSNP